MELLGHLARAEVSLKRQSEYYLEPGSEHRDYSGDEHFVRLGQAARTALLAIEELAAPASVFLLPQAIEALDDLVREDWNAAYDASHAGEYIDKAYALVTKAQAEVLKLPRQTSVSSAGPARRGAPAVLPAGGGAG